MTLAIPLTQGKFVLIDDEDWLLITAPDRQWFAHKSRYTFYATCKYRGMTLKMHRLIMGFPRTGVIDHKNRNGLDNRRQNLHVVTDNENLYNKRLYKNNSSGTNGVYFCRTERGRRFWHAQISRGGKQIFIGRFLTKEEAILARKEAEHAYANT